MEKKRIRDYGVNTGRLKTGKRNKITDVPGVLVGHCTIKNEENHTGVTVILPGSDNSFSSKYTAASYVHNGFGKSCGLIQVEELGTLETPIALTNTLNVGLVWDAVAGYVIDRCEKDQVPVASVNPVVGECNDSRMNHIQKRAVKETHVLQAFADAKEDFEEGDVGAGAGTSCYGLKGGIGSASRVVEIAGKEYTIGVLVQSNFGATMDFVLGGKMAGQWILEQRSAEKASQTGEKQERMAVSEQDKGSIMTILATDLPVSSRQLKRIIRRTAVGIARTGAYTGHGSGEVMIGFTTANRIPDLGREELLTISVIPEHTINQAFQAAAEAAHEAILNSMVCAESTRGIGGEMYYSLAEFLPDCLEAD
ncbi:MAG: P1 family peptidase [Lachnospiraceae bacterium]|nr:P1 family peptidase [Lachnospiraceae bacterium]